MLYLFPDVSWIKDLKIHLLFWLQVWGGNPARFLRKLTEEEMAFISQSAINYSNLARVHAAENAKSFDEIEFEKLLRKKFARRDEEYDSMLGVVRETPAELILPDNVMQDKVPKTAWVWLIQDRILLLRFNITGVPDILFICGISRKWVLFNFNNFWRPRKMLRSNHGARFRHIAVLIHFGFKEIFFF